MPSRIPVRVGGPEFHRRRASAPSKLEQLAADYQRKLHEDKERKLVRLYQDESDHMIRREPGYGSAGNNLSGRRVGMNNGYGGRDRGVIREFFQERRQLASGEINNNQYHENIKYHYQKKKNTQRTAAPGKPPIPQNRSAGHDKSKPLAPISRAAAGRQPQTNGHSDHGSSVAHSPKPPTGNRAQYVRSHRRGSQSSGSDSPPPIDMNNLPPDKALIPVGRRKNVIPAIATPSTDREHSVSTPGSDSQRQTSGYGKWREEQQRLQEERDKNAPNRSPQVQRRAAPPQTVKHSPQLPRKQPVLPPALKKEPPEKLTSFQKWQQEQDKEREDRLQDHRDQKTDRRPSSPRQGDSESDLTSRRTPHSRPPSGKTQQRKQSILKNTRPRTPSSDEDDDDDEQAEIRRKQARLESLIEQQKRELQDMRQKRKQEEDREHREEDKRQKRAAAERERARRLAEAEDRGSHSRLSRQSSHDGYHSNTPSRQASVHSRYTPSRSPTATPVAPSPPPIRRKPSLPKKKPAKPAPPPRAPTPDNNANTAFYLESAATEGAFNDDLDLSTCHICGRKFASDRLARHAKVCQGAKKKRKVLDPVKMRSQGTEYAQYSREAAKAKRQKTPPKKNWRAQHENFIESIRYAKKVTEVESAGGNVADLAPPPAAVNPDYKQCPYCDRRFAPTTADRHIPKCKDTKSRPAPPKHYKRR